MSISRKPEGTAAAHPVSAAAKPGSEMAGNIWRTSSARDTEVESHLARARLQLPGPDYLEIISRLHDYLQPETYVEIGVEFGTTLKLVQSTTRVVAIDPFPQVAFALPAKHTLYRCTSDDFFADNDLSALLGAPLELAFIDGLHVFEQVLRDFINLEKYASAGTVILIHDCLPLDERTSSRQRQTQFWSGDVWKIVPCLKRERPELKICTVPAYPTGLCMVTGLQRHSSCLSDNYAAIIEKYRGLEYRQITERNSFFSLLPNRWEAVEAFLENALSHIS